MKKKNISNKIQRVVLSDILPFEIPATFSNRFFYSFISENEIELNGNKISWKSESLVIKPILKLLFNLERRLITNETAKSITIEITKGALKTIPFHYKISHKKNEFRELSVIHPKNQLAVTEFYEKNKDLILYYSNESEFSLRRPFKTAKFTYFKDRLHYDKLAADHESSGAEEFDKEYENLKTFFSYKEISNIHKFYESYKYQRCEKKYDKLFKFDISKCFDSIYSHSITWALLDKECVKHKIPLSLNTFGGKFDRLMQDLNYGETNGIIIGPEFSRIFAEMILQKIDKEVQYELLNLDQKLSNRKEFEIFRYVDDFFVFYNEDVVKDEVVNRFRVKLREYKLGINEQKNEHHTKPILTGITEAKINITDLIDKNLSFAYKNSNNEKLKDDKNQDYYVSFNKLITKYKLIVKSSDIAYKDIQNFTLGCIDNKLTKLLEVLTENKIPNVNDIQLILGFLDLSFFIYTVNLRVNSTIKLCSITSKITQFSKLHLTPDFKDRVFKKIYDEIFLVLKKERIKEHVQIETLYLLIALNELGKEYRLDEYTLANYLGINLKSKQCNFPLHYFSITVTLFYIGNKIRYQKLKSILKSYILEKIEIVSFENRLKHTELVMLFFDILTCPFLDRKFKNKIFLLFGVPSSQGAMRTKIIEHRKFWFTKWENFNFGNEIEAKKSQEVY